MSIYEKGSRFSAVQLEDLNLSLVKLLLLERYTRYCFIRNRFIRNSTQIFRRIKEPVLNFWVIRNKITISIGEMSLILLKLLFKKIFKE